MKTTTRRLALVAFLFVALPLLAQDDPGQAKVKPPRKKPAIGYDNTPFIPGQKWRVHDISRPRPPIVKPGMHTSPPSDAIVLFDGTDLSGWEMQGKGPDKGKMLPAAWKVENGYMEVAPKAGSIFSKQKFGDMQLHIEFATPQQVKGDSQGRGNSGVIIMGKYEIQVLDSFDNVTYADGQAGAIYGQFPPLVNASRGPGQWQAFDIIFEAPQFKDETLLKPAYSTVIHNGVLLHHRQAHLGPMAHKVLSAYKPHPPKGALMLQAHGNPTRFRNIWVRPLN